MSTVLVHSYHFPPIGGSGAQRPLKMVRYLVDRGYTAVVVTGAGATADRWAPEDGSLVAEIPEQVEIRRVSGASEPHPSTGARAAAERWLGVDGRWSSWWVDRSYALGLDAGRDADLVYVWMQPYVSAEAGAALARALRKPWVADLGDPWALDEMMVYPTALHRRAAERQMGKLLGTAAAIVLSTPEALARFARRFPELADRPVVAIPNGFDPADFAGEADRPADGRFRIVHTGYLHTELGEHNLQWRAVRRLLRGSVPGVDILTRSHVHLVEAIDRVLALRPELADVVELHLAGVLTDADRRVAAPCPVARLHGPLTHADSIALMRSAELLFLPMQNLPAGTRATIVPGKTYEYLASGTPILGAVPDGDARDILEAAGNATVVRPDDVAAIADALLLHLDRFRAGAPPQAPDPDLVARFRYPKLAADLADVFDAVLGARGERPAPAAR